MLSIARLRGPLIMGIFPLQKYELPKKSVNETVETRMERIKKLFVSTKYEPVSKELRTVISMTTTAGVVGMIAGGIIHTKGAVEKFIDNNQATLFYSQFDAQREAQKSFAIQFLKGAYKFGWRTALFTAIFGSVQLLLTTYHGEPSVLHYIVGGGTAGFLFKLSLGIRGSLIGLIVGSILGGIGGFLTLSVLKLTGLSMEDLHNIGQQWTHTSDEKYKEFISQSISDEFKEAKLMYDENKKVQMQLSMKEEKTKN